VPQPRLVRWETLTKKAFDSLDREKCVVLVTCSPMEVHGPHLPLGADALEGEGLAERMLRFLPERHQDRVFLKLPMIYTATDVVPQPGSLHFHPSTTVTVLTDLGRTLGAQGLRDVFISNFHGGPRHFLSIEKACERANRRYGTRMISVFSLLISRLTNGTSNLDDVLGNLPGVNKADLAGDTHGGFIETSQLLALHGDWIDPDYKQLPRLTVDTWLEANGAARPKVGRGDPRRFFEMLRSYRAGLRFFTENTYSGAPGGASAEVGERIMNTLAGYAGEACGELLDGKLRPEDCHSPIWKLRFLFLNPLMIRTLNRLLGFRNPIA
jgi:creatinine amidohydrolase